MPVDKPQATTEAVLAAAADSRLLPYLSIIGYDAIDAISVVLAELHNTGEIDLLQSFQSDEFEADSPHLFYKLLEVFRRTFPLIQCQVAVALPTIRSVNMRLQKAGVAATAHDALFAWLKECPGPSRGSSSSHPKSHAY